MVFAPVRFCGYSVKFSPFLANRLAVASAQNFGIIGNGRCTVLEVSAGGSGGLGRVTQHRSPPAHGPRSHDAPRVRAQMAPGGLVEVAAFDTVDGLYDVAWSEENEAILLAACGDGSIKVYDLAAPPGANPMRSLHEHKHEVGGPRLPAKLAWRVLGRTGNIPICSSAGSHSSQGGMAGRQQLQSPPLPPPPPPPPHSHPRARATHPHPATPARSAARSAGTCCGGTCSFRAAGTTASSCGTWARRGRSAPSWATPTACTTWHGGWPPGGGGGGGAAAPSPLGHHTKPAKGWQHQAWCDAGHPSRAATHG